MRPRSPSRRDEVREGSARVEDERRQHRRRSVAGVAYPAVVEPSQADRPAEVEIDLFARLANRGIARPPVRGGDPSPGKGHVAGPAFAGAFGALDKTQAQGVVPASEDQRHRGPAPRKGGVGQESRGEFLQSLPYRGDRAHIREPDPAVSGTPSARGLSHLWSDMPADSRLRGNDGMRRLERAYSLDVPSATAGTGPLAFVIPAKAGIHRLAV